MMRYLAWVAVLSCGVALAKPPTKKELAARVAQLASEEEATRTEASAALVKAGKPAVPLLAAYLKAGPSRVGRAQAAIALGALGETAASARLVLVAALGDRSVEVQTQAEKALPALGVPSSKQLRGLMALVDHAHQGVRIGACKQLGSMGRKAAGATKLLRKRLDTLPLPHPKDGRALAEALGAIDPAQLALVIKVKRSATLTKWVLAAIGTLGRERGARVAPAVRTTLAQWHATADEPGKVVPRMALDVYAEIATPKQTLSLMLEILKRKKDSQHLPEQRREAIRHLSKLGKDGKPAVGALIAHLDHEQATIRAAAADALGKIGVPAKPIVKAFRRRLGRVDAAQRQSMLRAMCALGTPAGPALLEAMRGKKVGKAGRLIVLGQVGRTVAEPAKEWVAYLVERLGDTDEDVRVAASAAVGRMGAVALPALRGALGGEDRGVKRLALRALGQLGMAAAPAVDEIAAQLDALDPDVKNGARDALRVIARAARGAKTAEGTALATKIDGLLKG